MFYTDPHAAEWDVASVDQFTTRQLDRIQAEMEAIVLALGLTALVVDLELCGSYAFGSARPHSDLDIAIVAIDSIAQRAIDTIMRPEAKRIQMGRLRFTASANLGIKCDVAWKSHDNRAKGNTVYSLRLRRLFGRLPGARQDIRRKWNQATSEWELVARPDRIWQKL